MRSDSLLLLLLLPVVLSSCSDTGLGASEDPLATPTPVFAQGGAKDSVQKFHLQDSYASTCGWALSAEGNRLGWVCVWVAEGNMGPNKAAYLDYYGNWYASGPFGSYGNVIPAGDFGGSVSGAMHLRTSTPDGDFDLRWTARDDFGENSRMSGHSEYRWCDYPYECVTIVQSGRWSYTYAFVEGTYLGHDFDHYRGQMGDNHGVQRTVYSTQ
jgi:hypothetical protein